MVVLPGCCGVCVWQEGVAKVFVDLQDLRRLKEIYWCCEVSGVVSYILM